MRQEQADGAKGRFDANDRRRLKRALSKAREARVYRRIEAVLWVAEGHAISEAARRVRAPRLSVRRWIERYLIERDVTALADQARSGRPRLADQIGATRLDEILERDPRNDGYLATTWTVPLLVHYLHEHDAIAVSAHTLRRRLREAGYRWKRPRYVYVGRAEHLGQKKGA